MKREETKKSFIKRVKKSGSESILTKRSTTEKVLFGIVFVIFALYALTLVLPFLFMFISSLKSSLEYIDDLIAGSTLGMPDEWMFSNYVLAFTQMSVQDSMGNDVFLPQMLLNSVWYTAECIIASVGASAITGYCLSKYRFKIRGLLYGVAIFSMTIPIIGSSGAAMKLAYNLGIYNTPLYPLLTGFSGFGFNFLILYGFFSGIPWSYAEAVFMDGGGHGTTFFKIMLPQAWPAMLTLSIMTFISAWNNYMTPLLYLPDFPTMASGIYRIKLTFTRGGNYPAYYAGLLVSTLPVVLLFVCFSDVIMKNFTVGGLKG